MSLAILFHFLCAQHVSEINISIIRSLRLFCWITTLVVLFLVRYVLEFRCGWVGVVSVLQAEASASNTANVVIQQNSRKLLMMDILMSETCWAHKKWNKIASGIKLVFYSSAVSMLMLLSCWLGMHVAYIKIFDMFYHHYVPEGLGVFPVRWSSRWSWSLHLFLCRPMFLRPFGLYCGACFGSLFVSILCTCCSHIFWYCFISFTMFCAPVFSLIHWFFSLSSFVIPSKGLKNFICAAFKRCSSLFFSTQASLPNFNAASGVMLWILNFVCVFICFPKCLRMSLRKKKLSVLTLIFKLTLLWVEGAEGDRDNIFTWILDPMRWAGLVARTVEKREVYRVLVGKPEGRRALGRPRRRWMDNIRMDLQEVGCVYMDWTGLAQDRDRWRTLVSAVMNLRVPWNAGNFLTSCKPVNFSRRTLHHAVSK